MIIVTFLLVYAIVLAGTCALYHRAPPSLREAILACASVLFLALAVSPRLAVPCLVEVGVLFWMLRRPPSLARHALFLAGLSTFYVCVPQHVLRLPHQSVSDLILIPENLIGAGILLGTFRRAVFCYYESCHPRLGAFSALSLLNYLMGLPFLVPLSATPSFRHFLESRTATPLSVSLRRGLETCTICLACLVLWRLGLAVPAVADVTVSAAASMTAGEIWLFLGTRYVLVYLYRMGTQQMSVGAWRLFGYDIRDNFLSPLLSTSLVDYWRRWNVLWREFLLMAVFYPLTLSLGRWSRKPRPWHFFLAALATFGASGVLNVLPVVLFASPLVWSPEKTVFSSSELLYDLVLGVLVGLNLFYLATVRARRGKESPSRGWQWAGIACTFLLIAACRVLLYTPSDTLEEKARLLLRALGV